MSTFAPGPNGQRLSDHDTRGLTPPPKEPAVVPEEFAAQAFDDLYARSKGCRYTVWARVQPARCGMATAHAIHVSMRQDGDDWFVMSVFGPAPFMRDAVSFSPGDATMAREWFVALYPVWAKV